MSAPRQSVLILSAVLLPATLLWVAAQPPASQPPKLAKKYTWSELPTDEQVKTVAVKRVEPQPGEPKSVNAELTFELGSNVRPYTPATAKVGKQEQPARGAGTLPPRRMEVDFAQLVRDRDKYAADAATANGITSHAGGRSAKSSALVKPNFPDKKETPEKQFPLGTGVALEPYFRGIPDNAVGPELRKKLVANSLMITDTGVVNDKRTRGKGKWGFGHLMTQLANEPETGIRPAEFVRRWLDHWAKDVAVGGFTVRNRAVGLTKFLEKWPKTDTGELDLDKAPFRLLAIASRLDLRNNFVLGAERIGGGGAGEGRFVFCATLGDAADPKSPPLAFTAIFEFQVKKSDFEGVRAWAEQWYRLADLKLGSPEYLTALEKVTDQFAGANADPESPPNRSALAALRTNEIALDLLAAAAGEPFSGARLEPEKPTLLWELREFRLATHASGYLEQVTAKQTPHLKFDNSPRLGAFLNDPERERQVLAKAHRTPPEFPSGRPFLDGSSPTPVNQFWKFGDPNAPKQGEIRSGEARHLFSLGTCSGCHAGEAFAKQENFAGDDLTKDQPPPLFTHVRPRQHDKAARLSDFLRGAGEEFTQDFELPDPAGWRDGSAGVKSRKFGDLRRRVDDLYSLVHYGWHYELHRLPIQFVH